MVCYDGGSNDYGGIVFMHIMITMVGGIGQGSKYRMHVTFVSCMYFVHVENFTLFSGYTS